MGSREIFLGMADGWFAAAAQCKQCGVCARRCEIFDPEGPFGEGLRSIASHGAQLASLLADTAEQDAGNAAYGFLTSNPGLYELLRSCCFCNHCTSSCLAHLSMVEVMRPWRQLLASCGILNAADSKSVMVDNEWHIFSVYRAVYGIYYPEFAALGEVECGQVDTVFFPGCSLSSYAPHLVRRVGNWLDEQGFSWALSLDCCGSPLASAGLMERSVALRRRILEQCKAAGVKRLITVCAGCGEELAAVFDESIEIVPLPQLLVEGGARVALAAGEGAGAAGAADAVGAAGEYASGIAGEVAASCGDSGILGVFDSCHDRNCAHGCQIRELLAGRPQAEVTYHGKFTLCCGAGGAAPSYNPGLSEARVARALRAAQVSGVDTLVTSCPTCSYTFNQHLLGAAPVAGERAVQCRHYLELLFDEAIDWAAVFARLQDMWSGEYAAWVYEQLV